MHTRGKFCKFLLQNCERIICQFFQTLTLLYDEIVTKFKLDWNFICGFYYWTLATTHIARFECFVNRHAQLRIIKYTRSTRSVHFIYRFHFAHGQRTEIFHKSTRSRSAKLCQIIMIKNTKVELNIFLTQYFSDLEVRNENGN